MDCLGEKKDRPKCIRCGVCCVFAICNFGKESRFTGLCKYLKIHRKKGYATCKIIKKHGNMFPGGCVLRGMGTSFFEKYTKIAEEKVGFKLSGIGEQNANICDINRSADDKVKR